MKQSFWKTISGPFSVASVYVGALVGPALVAGTYATVFYLSNGCNSLWLPFLACGIVGLMCLSAAYPWIRTCYYILMLLAIVSSTIPATYMISSRYQSALKFIPALKTDNSRNIVAAILFMVICTLIGALGLTNLANTGLTIVSYIGMPLVVIPLFFIWPQRTRKFRQAERERAAGEQKS